LRQYYVMVGLGAFVTALTQPAVIGRLPLRLLLKTTLRLDAQSVAMFMLLATFAWNLKPIAGIFSDSYRIFGTRRRHYMILGAGLAALCWASLALLPRTFWPLLLATFAANVFIVVASTVTGGLMVEVGQRHSGREVTSLRQGLQTLVS